MGVVTTPRPTLRWTRWASETLIELGRERSLSPVTIQLRSRDDHVRVPRPLAPGVWFWRIRHLQRLTDRGSVGPTWYFVVRAQRDVTDTSWPRPSRGCDLDGDGHADFVRNDLDGNNEGSAPHDTIDLNLGTAAGFGRTRRVQVAVHTEPSCVGDVNGDGRGDLALFGDLNAGGRTLLLRGGAGGLDPSVLALFASGIAGVGDVDRDGYGDLVTTGDAETAGWFLPGGPVGPTEARGARLAEGSPTALGDVDGDGFADVGLRNDHGIAVLRGGHEGPVRDALATIAIERNEVLLVGHDVDGDGRADVVTARGERPDRADDEARGALRLRVFTAPLFNAPISLVASAVTDRTGGGAEVTIVDDDGDGDGDVVVLPAPPPYGEAASGPARVRVFDGGAGLGTGAPRVVMLAMPPHPGSPTRLLGLGDVDRDGRDDLGLQVDCGWPAWLEAFRGGTGPRRAAMRGITWGCGFLP